MPAPLAILCATRGERVVRPFLQAMVELATACDAVLRFVADGEDAVIGLRVGGFSRFIQPVASGDSRHGVMQWVADSIAADYILFLDDDECCSPTLRTWLVTRQYPAAPLWWLRRAWLWKSLQQRLADRKHWPDLQLRLGRRDQITIPTTLHAGWIARAGRTPLVAPGALEHHKFLIRSLTACAADVAVYEAQRPRFGCAAVYLSPFTKAKLVPWREARR